MAYMSDNIVQVADGSVVVFDKDTKEAYVLQPHSIPVIDSDLRRLRIFGQRDKLRLTGPKGRETWA